MTPNSPPPPASLGRLFAPRAIAVVGASSNPAAIGGRPIHYALATGFRGTIYPVNPSRPEIQGLKAYPHISAIPGSIDLVIVAVNADLVADAITAAAERGARAAVIFSAGFAEAGAEGLLLQTQLRELCREKGVRALGPNCLGSYNASIGHTATFASCFQDGFPRPGSIALVSQSGAYGSYLLLLAIQQGIGVGQWVTTGNEMDVSVANVVSHLAEDPQVKVIGCVAEGVTDGPALLAALEKAREAQKSVVLMKMGRTRDGAATAKSHTAALAVDDAVFEAVIRQAGAHRVRTTREMLDLLYALELRPALKGNRLGIVTMSGGVGVLLSDAAADAGLTVPQLPPDVIQTLHQRNPMGASHNPVDVTGQAMKNPRLFGDALRALLHPGRCDAIVVFLMNWLTSKDMGSPLKAEIDAALDGANTTVAIVGSMPAQHAQLFRERGTLVFDDPDRAINTLGAMARIGSLAIQPFDGTPAIDLCIPPVDGSERDEVRAKQLLARVGLLTPQEVVVANAREAGDAAERIGGAVALKIVSADLPHKSDVGGVRLGLRGRSATAAAAAEMSAKVAERCPTARLQGFIVSAMIDDGIEMIIATHKDPVFGMLTMVGVGGTLVELERDVTFRYGAVNVAEALRMIAELDGAKLLRGVRGAPPADIDALAAAISRLSHFGVANRERIAGVEINPILVRPAGQGCVILDALICFEDPAPPRAITG